MQLMKCNGNSKTEKNKYSNDVVVVWKANKKKKKKKQELNYKISKKLYGFTEEIVM